MFSFLGDFGTIRSASEPVRELVLFNLGIDSKLGECDLVALRVRDI